MASPAKIVREPFDPVLKAHLAELASAIRETNDHCWNILVRCAKYGDVAPDIGRSALGLFHQMLSMTEGMAALAETQSTSGATVLLRAEYEAWLALEFMVEADESFEARSLAWQVADLRRRLHEHELNDKRSKRGREYRARVARDKFARNARRPSQPDVRRRIEGYREVLSREPHASINAKFEKLQQGSRRVRHVHWYQLDNGPESLSQLAERLEFGATHQILYGGWSTVSHAGDMFAWLERDADGASVIKQPNDPRELPQICTLGARLMMSAAIAMLNRFRRGESGASVEWFARTLVPELKRLARVEIATLIERVP